MRSQPRRSGRLVRRARRRSGSAPVPGTNSDTRRGQPGERAGDEERLPVVVGAEHGVTDDRSDAETAEHGDREVARRLGPAVRRGEVGHQRRRTDEQGGLADPGHAAQHEQHPQRVDGRAQEPGDAGEQRAADHHGPPAVALDEASDHRAHADRRRRERGQAEADAELAGAELVADERRHERHEHPDVREERQRRGGHRDERLRHEAGRRHARHVGGHRAGNPRSAPLCDGIHKHRARGACGAEHLSHAVQGLSDGANT